jgi:hypothetical protein
MSVSRLVSVIWLDRRNLVVAQLEFHVIAAGTTHELDPGDEGPSP